MDCSKKLDSGSEDEIEWRLHQLRRAIEMGSCRNIRSVVKHWGDTLAAASKEIHRAEYAWLKRKAQRMFIAEQNSGSGSLLELDHPYVLALMSTPTRTFTDGELANARKNRGS